MLYICINCSYDVDIAPDPKSGYKARCPKCRAAMVPRSEIPVVDFEGKPVLDFSADRVFRYCACPNARYCHIYDLYRPSCEDLVFSPLCLQPLFSELEKLKRSQQQGALDTDKTHRSKVLSLSTDRRTPKGPDK